MNRILGQHAQDFEIFTTTRFSRDRHCEMYDMAGGSQQSIVGNEKATSRNR